MSEHYFERLILNEDFQRFMKEALEEYKIRVRLLFESGPEMFYRHQQYIYAVQDIFFDRIKKMSPDNKRKRLQKILFEMFSAAKLDTLLDDCSKID